MTELDIKKIMENQLFDGPKYFYKNISVDAVVFGYHEKKLKVLLQRPQKFPKWTLPGGYVLKEESVEKAAFRTVNYRTNLTNINLNQFKVFSKPGRNKDSVYNPEFLSKIAGTKISKDNWTFENFISVAFFVLTEFSLVHPTGDAYMEECSWWEYDNLPELIYDHAEIIQEALKALKIFIHYHPIGNDLLPEKFTLPELHSLYETVLQKQLDIRNFTKKLINLGLIEKTDEQRNIGAHRSPFLYIFNKEKYEQMIRDGDVMVI